jgi:hypothetical protein
VQRIAAQDLVEDRVDKTVAKLDEGIHLTGGTGLPGQVFLEFLPPGLSIEPKPIAQLTENQVDVHRLKIVRNQLGNHGAPKLLNFLAIINLKI